MQYAGRAGALALIAQSMVPIFDKKGKPVGRHILATHANPSKTYKPNGARERARRARQLGLPSGILEPYAP